MKCYRYVLVLMIGFMFVGMSVTPVAGFDGGEMPEFMSVLDSERGVQLSVTDSFRNRLNNYFYERKIGIESYRIISDEVISDLILVLEDDVDLSEFADDYDSFDDVDIEEIDVDFVDEYKLCVVEGVRSSEVIDGYFGSSDVLIDDDRVISIYSDEPRDFEVGEVREDKEERDVSLDEISEFYKFDEIEGTGNDVSIAVVDAFPYIDGVNGDLNYVSNDDSISYNDGDVRSTHLLNVIKSISPDSDYYVYDVFEDGGVKPSNIIFSASNLIERDVDIALLPSIDVYERGSFYELLPLMDGWDERLYVTGSGDLSEDYANNPSVFDNVYSVGSVDLDEGALSSYSNLYFHFAVVGENVRAESYLNGEVRDYTVSSTFVSAAIFSGMLSIYLENEPDMLTEYEEIYNIFSRENLRLPLDVNGDGVFSKFGSYEYEFGGADLYTVFNGERSDMADVSEDRSRTTTFWEISSWRFLGRNV